MERSHSWSSALVSKTGRVARFSGVRISPSPPRFQCRSVAKALPLINLYSKVTSSPCRMLNKIFGIIKNARMPIDMKNKYTFVAEMWLYPGMAGNWHFVSLPTKEGIYIKKTFSALSPGWGSLRVEAQVGKTKWKTSIFPDKKRGTYLLPVKSAVRKFEDIHAGDKFKITLSLQN